MFDEWKFVALVLSLIVGLFGITFVPMYYSCKVRAQIVNKEFGTSYTTGEIFWAGETIDNVVLGQKARIDLNGAR